MSSGSDDCSGVSSAEGVTFAELLRNAQELKPLLLNKVSTAMIKEPKFDPKQIDESTATIKQYIEDIAKADPEFPLKLAVYVRDDLGLRGSANMIASIAAYVPGCAPYLPAYLKKIIVLPSDWLQIATFARDMPNRTGSGLPSALRKALLPIFDGFNEYSLAKYNKEAAQKKKAKRQAAAAAAVDDDSDDGSGGDDDDEEDKPLPPYTIKQMIRMLHIDSNPYFVMSVLGKRYPATSEEFEVLGLNKGGRVFDPSKAGQRMRLAVPKTWETELAAKGNHAYVWDELVESSQLPFMAMLRNLRNVILAGCKRSTHDTILNRLKNEDQIASSRQFPYRFFSAYDAISFSWEDVYESPAPGEPATKQPKPAPGQRPVKRKPWPPTNIPNDALVQEYRDALDKAVQLATAINIRPISGRTIVAVHLSDELWERIQAAGGAKGIGASVREYADVASLLALMFKYACEDCTFLIFRFGSKDVIDFPRNGKILENMASVLERMNALRNAVNDTDQPFPYQVLQSLLDRAQPLDALVVIDTEYRTYADEYGVAPDGNGMRCVDMPFMLSRLRQELNPNLLYVAVDVKGSTASSDVIEAFKHPNDVQIAGFSDSILRFVAERGNGGPLAYVERIDQVKNIDTSRAKVKQSCTALAVPADFGLTPAGSSEESGSSADNESDADAASTTVATTEESTALPPPPCFTRTDVVECRFFLSSTFLDMKSERDALVLEVFPALRRRCHQHKLRATITEIDLRWGITTDDAEKKLTLPLCLNETAACAPFFLGIVGARRGYCPPRYAFTPIEGSPVPPVHFEWLNDATPGLSITELEYRQAMESTRLYRENDQIPSDAPTALLLVRDAAVTANTVPNSHKHLFVPESNEAAAAQQRFIVGARSSDETRCIKYRAPFAHFDERNSVALQMEDFKHRALNALWDVVRRAAAHLDNDDDDDGEVRSPLDHENALQDNALRGSVLGRETERASALAFVTGASRVITLSDGSTDTSSPVMLVQGQEGCGKSAVVRDAAMRAASLPQAVVVYHSFGVGDGTAGTALLRIATELIEAAMLSEEFTAPANPDEAADRLRDIYNAAARFGRVVIVLDDLDATANQTDLLTVLPVLVPTPPPSANMRFVVSTLAGSEFANALKQRRPPVETLNVGDLLPEDRAPIIRAHLARVGKKLQESKRLGNQILPLTKKADAAKPAYLVQALTFLRLFSTFDTLDKDIRSVGSTTVAIQTDILMRYEKRFSVAVVRPVLVALYLSGPVGGLLELDAQRMGPTGTVAEARQLLFALEGVLEHRGGCVRIADSGLCTAIAKRYLKGRDEIPKAHAALVDFYTATLRKSGGAGSDAAGSAEPPSVLGKGRNIRDIPLSQLQGAAGQANAKAQERKELPYSRLAGRSLTCLMHHALGSKQYEVLEGMISSVICMETIIEAGLLPQLLNAVAALATAARLVHRKLQPFVEFLISHRHILTRHRELTLQCALNMPPKSEVRVAALRVPEAERNARSMILWTNRVEHGESDCTQTTAITTKEVLAVAFDDAGKKLAVGGKDWTVRVVDIYDGTISRVIKHPNDVTAVLLLRNTIMTGAEDGVLRIFSRTDGALIAQGTGHTRRITQIAAHPQGQYVVTSSLDGTVKRWSTQGEAKKLKSTSNTRRHGAPVSCVAIHQSGKVHGSGGWEGRAYFWTFDRDVKPVWFNTKRKCAVRALAFTPSLVVIAAVASYDGGVDLFDFAGEVHQIALNTQHLGRAITSIEYSADGKRMLSSDVRGNAKLWRAGVVGEVLSTFSGHAKGLTAARFDPTDNTKLITASLDSTVRHWSAPVNEARPVASHGAAVTCLAAAPNGSFVVSASRDGTAHCMLKQDGGVTLLITHDEGRTPLSAVAIGPRSDIIVTGDINGRVYAWAPRGGLGGNDCQLLWANIMHTRAVKSLAVEDFTEHPSAPQVHVWVAFTDGTVKRLNSDGKGGEDFRVPPFVGHGVAGGGIIADHCFAAFSPTGATGKVFGEMRSSSSFASRDGDSGCVRCVAFNSAANLVVTGSDDGKLELFNAPYIDSHEATLTTWLDDEFKDDVVKINAIAFVNPELLVVACEDRSVRFVAIENGDATETLSFFATAAVTAVVADGPNVVCGDALGNVYRLQPKYAAGGAGEARGSAMHVTNTTESMGAVTIESSLIEDFAEDDTSASYAGLQASGAASLLATYDSLEAFQIILEDVPRTLRGPDRKAWLLRQRDALRAAMKLHRVCDHARLAMRLYAQKGMQMMGAYMKLSDAGATGPGVPQPIFATFQR